ncbi:MAG: GNAT family N-acetyltransferase [Pseudonocardiaceae bacterium]
MRPVLRVPVEDTSRWRPTGIARRRQGYLRGTGNRSSARGPQLWSFLGWKDDLLDDCGGRRTKIRLRPLQTDDEQAVRAAHLQMSREDFQFALGLTPDTAWSSYLHRMAREQVGVSLPPDRVPATFLLAEVAGEIVGRVSVRHRLDDWLLAHGGHIGYGVLPPFRRRGFATEILRQGLIIARAFGVGRVLVVYDNDNAGSIR